MGDDKLMSKRGGKGKGKGYEQSQIDLMEKGITMFGMSIYGVETLAALHPFIEAFKDEGVSGINDLIFDMPSYSDTTFYKTVNGDMEYNDEAIQTVEAYFRGYAATMETTAIVMMAIHDPIQIAQWWPRAVASYWDFAQAGLMEKM